MVPFASSETSKAPSFSTATPTGRPQTSESLTARFKPIVAKATAQVKLASLYDQYAGQAAQFGLVKSQDAHLNDYVTGKALDGTTYRDW